jgi:hypothetical protein
MWDLGDKQSASKSDEPFYLSEAAHPRERDMPSPMPRANHQDGYIQAF